MKKNYLPNYKIKLKILYFRFAFPILNLDIISQQKKN